MNLFWLTQTEADVPGSDDWLSPGEQVRLEAMRFPKRRGDWRLGRWTAKQAIAAFLKLPADEHAFARIEVRAADCGAPRFGHTTNLPKSRSRLAIAMVWASVLLHVTAHWWAVTWKALNRVPMSSSRTT
jgi:hypothetical protein